MLRGPRVMLERYFPGSEVLEVAQAGDVADLVAAASAEQRPVYPVGGGTSLGLGVTDNEPGTILSLKKLNGLIDYPSRDLTITVEAGMTLAELAGHLAAEKQRLPIDIAGAESATVGGIVTANLSGPRRYGYGTVRDYLLGVDAVDGTGKTFSAGGRVVKNAAGYDLTRLMIGSLGTLGVITQVTLMVRPQPEMSAFAVMPLSSMERADSLLESVQSNNLEPVAIELVASDRFRAGPHAAATINLWVGFESSELEVRWMLDRVKELCGKAGLEIALIEEADVIASCWRELTEHGAYIGEDRRESTLAVEAVVLPSKTVAAAESLRAIDPSVSLHCRAGNGVVLGQFECKPNDGSELAGKVRGAIAELGGKVVVTEHPFESRLDRQAIWGSPGPEVRVMERIKQRFDPDGILNPGRFVLGRPTANVQS